MPRRTGFTSKVVTTGTGGPKKASNKAIEYFQQDVERTPLTPLAHGGLADSYVLLGWNSYLLPKEAFPKGNGAAKMALQLDRDLAEAHTPFAALLWLHDWQGEEAGRDLSAASN